VSRFVRLIDQTHDLSVGVSVARDEAAEEAAARADVAGASGGGPLFAAGRGDGEGGSVAGMDAGAFAQRGASDADEVEGVWRAAAITGLLVGVELELSGGFLEREDDAGGRGLGKAGSGKVGAW
jgi:hypothetical protein